MVTLFLTYLFSNPFFLFFRYINKSAIHRLILYPDNTFPAQFRTVTILFVSLGDVKPWTREGLDTCQKAIYQVHKVTSEYEGRHTLCFEACCSFQYKRKKAFKNIFLTKHFIIITPTQASFNSSQWTTRERHFYAHSDFLIHDRMSARRCLQRNQPG